MRKMYYIVLASMLLLCACGKSVDTRYKIDINKYNQEIANITSLSDGISETTLINDSDLESIKRIYAENKLTASSQDVRVDFLMGTFINELKTDILLKYNYKYYRYEYAIDEPGDYDEENRLSQEEIDATSILYRDIDKLYDDFMAVSDVNDELLEKVHSLCDRYIRFSTRQKSLIYNYAKLAELVESFGGSLDTNFNLELWKYNTRKYRGEAVGEYSGPSDEELGIVMGNQRYDEYGSPFPDINSDLSNNTENNESLSVPTYDVESASFNDLETKLEIPIEFYDCVVDTGNSGTNYIDDEKLYKHIASLDSSLHSDRNSIYLKVTDSMGEIKLLNWGTLNYYVPENKYHNYTVKDSIYWDSGRFKVGLLSEDGKDYKTISGSLRGNKIYFDDVNSLIQKFEAVHVDLTENVDNLDYDVNALENVPHYEDESN